MNSAPTKHFASIDPDPLDDPYASVARFYGICLDPFIIRWKKKALRMWPPRPGMRVLDVGFGTGAQLNLYQFYGCSVYGIEISAGMIAAARKKFRDSLHLCRGNASRMPYRNQTFDWVLMSMMLHEISPPIRSLVLAETERVLKDSGRVLIIDYHAGRLNSAPGRILKGVITLIEIAAGPTHFKNYRNFIKNGGLPALLKKHRLVVENHDMSGRGNIGLTLVRKDLNAERNPAAT